VKVPVLVTMGVREDGSRVVLDFRLAGSESAGGWREAIVSLSERGIGVPRLAVIDGGAGLEKALREVWPRIAIQRCTAHKLRNLEGKAPVRMREELKEDYRRMVYAETAAAVEQARSRFLKKWRLACPPVAASLEEAGDELYTFLKFPRSQWKALRTTNALERINEEFRRRTKTQASLPGESAVLLLLFGLLRSGQIRLRAIDGCHEMKAAA
jgi:transposase-like protein